MVSFGPRSVVRCLPFLDEPEWVPSESLLVNDTRLRMASPKRQSPRTFYGMPRARECTYSIFEFPQLVS